PPAPSSFPTRRSSDLHAVAFVPAHGLQLQPGALQEVLDRLWPDQLHRGQLREAALVVDLDLGPILGRRPQAHAGAPTRPKPVGVDRKSTRLNSSHSQI